MGIKALTIFSKRSWGIWITMIIGIVGSILATYLGQALVALRGGKAPVSSAQQRDILLLHLPRNSRRDGQGLTKNLCPERPQKFT